MDYDDINDVSNNPEYAEGTACRQLRDRANQDNFRSRVRAVKRSDGMLFASMTEAAVYTGCSQMVIHAVCNGIGKTCGGYGWQYYEGRVL